MNAIRQSFAARYFEHLATQFACDAVRAVWIERKVQACARTYLQNAALFWKRFKSLFAPARKNPSLKRRDEFVVAGGEAIINGRLMRIHRHSPQRHGDTEKNNLR